jgi:hypothetical protein
MARGVTLGRMSEPRPPELRASDAERERTADQLRYAAGEGRLTVEELDERLNAATRRAPAATSSSWCATSPCRSP